MPTSPVYSDEQLLAVVRAAGDRFPTGPLTVERFAQTTTINPHTVLRRFGGWSPALAAAGLADRYSGRNVTAKMRNPQARRLTDAEVIAELRRIAADAGRDWITKADVHRSDRLGIRILLTRFGSWPQALLAAGLRPSPRTTVRTDRELLDNLQVVADQFGRLPRTRDLTRPPSRISSYHYRLRYGTWAAALDAFRQERLDQGQRHDDARP